MTWDRLLYFPIRKEGILKDFLTLIKNPMASAGFEPEILGTAVQHANHCATEASKCTVCLFNGMKREKRWKASSFLYRALQFLSIIITPLFIYLLITRDDRWAQLKKIYYFCSVVLFTFFLPNKLFFSNCYGKVWSICGRYVRF